MSTKKVMIKSGVALTTRELIACAKRDTSGDDAARYRTERKLLAAVISATAPHLSFRDVPQRDQHLDRPIGYGFSYVADRFRNHCQMLAKLDELKLALARADAKELDLSSYGRALDTFYPLRKIERAIEERHDSNDPCDHWNSQPCWLYRHLGPSETWPEWDAPFLDGPRLTEDEMALYTRGWDDEGEQQRIHAKYERELRAITIPPPKEKKK